MADPESAVHRKWADLCWPLITERNSHVLHTCSYRGNVHPLGIYKHLSFWFSFSSIIYLTPTLLSLCNTVSWLCLILSNAKFLCKNPHYTDQACLSTVNHAVYTVTRSMIHAVTELNPYDTNACAISDERWGHSVGRSSWTNTAKACRLITHKHLSQSIGCVLIHRSGPVHKIYPCLFT